MEKRNISQFLNLLRRENMDPTFDDLERVL